MKANRKIALPHRLLVALLSASLVLPAPGSDHADPQNVLNPFEMRQQQEANITDLHAFVVDKDWKVITRQPDAALGDQLILSLCVRRALTEKREKLPDRPSDSTQLMVDGFTFRIHLDLSPPVRFFDEEAAKREAGVREGDAAALAKFMADTNDARALQFRYGGIIERPSDIAEEAGLEFRLRYDRGNGRPDGDAVTIEHKRLTGAWTGPRAMHEVKGDGKPVGKLINVQAGIFDDPFIFPRFFRRNVVGIVTSIPLDRLPAVPKATKERPLVLWATTHDREGKQIDHVGRSLRTQLPRFGYLNTLPPAQHRTAIQRVHENPTLVEDFSRTFISVLIGRRHYDDVPDVMIYDLMRPAKFPNGRSFPDDVARALAEGGETLLLELSYVESEQFPRATVNDKPFLPDFPYLAKRWTNAEIAAARPGVTMAISDGSIIARPYDALGEVRDPAMFAPATKRKLWALGVLGVLGILALVAGLVWLGFHLGKHHARNKAGQPDDEGQGLTTGEEDALKPEAEESPPAADALYIERPEGSSYAEVHKFVISQEFSRPYDPGKLPTEGVSFWTLASGLLPWGKPSLLTRAIRRTLKTRTDLRWGKNGDGVTRLIHPNGICLAGKWIIEGIDGGHGKEPAPTGYTGWFEKGRQGFIIARWSPSRAETRRGHWRSMGLVAKIWPTIDINDTRVVHSASLITQEDLGGTNVQNVNDVDLRNAPDIHSWQRRGGLPGLLLTGIFFRLLNVNATIRQLHEIAELHHPTEEPVKHPRCPQLIRLKVLNRDIIAGEALDVREEILAHLRSGKFELSIEVSDHDPHGDAVRITDAYIERNIPEDAWRRIGRIEFTEGMCSKNGDRVIHFHHPVWREDVDDKETTARIK